LQDFRKHELVALFSARNFAKVLEIREAAGKLFKTGKVSTYTFKSINTRQTEAEVHEKLSEILSGNVTVRELNNAGKKVSLITINIQFFRTFLLL